MQTSVNTASGVIGSSLEGITLCARRSANSTDLRRLRQALERQNCALHFPLKSLLIVADTSRLLFSSTIGLSASNV